MILVSLLRMFRYAFQDFWRNFWLSLVTVFILVLTLLTINILFAFHYLTTSAIQAVESKLDVTIFFKPDVSDSAVFAVRDKLASLPEVSEVEFLSREARVQAFQALYEDAPAIVEAINEIDENPFGAALVIKAKQPRDYPSLIQALSSDEYDSLIEEKDYRDHQDTVKSIVAFTDRARRAVEIMSLVFAVIAILIVFNTIRVAIYTHRDEIGVMKAVGATNGFIRFPYILVSIFYSMLACGMAFALCYAALRFVDPYITNFFGSSVSLMAYFTRNALTIFGGQFLGALILNVMSSSFALGRYLRV